MAHKNIESTSTNHSNVSSFEEARLAKILETTSREVSTTNEVMNPTGQLSYMREYQDLRDDKRDKRSMRLARKAGAKIMEREDKEFF